MSTLPIIHNFKISGFHEGRRLIVLNKTMRIMHKLCLLTRPPSMQRAMGVCWHTSQCNCSIQAKCAPQSCKPRNQIHNQSTRNKKGREADAVRRARGARRGRRRRARPGPSRRAREARRRPRRASACRLRRGRAPEASYFGGARRAAGSRASARIRAPPRSRRGAPGARRVSAGGDKG